MRSRTHRGRDGCLDAARSLAHDHEKRRAAAIPATGTKSRPLRRPPFWHADRASRGKGAESPATRLAFGAASAPPLSAFGRREGCCASRLRTLQCPKSTRFHAFQPPSRRARKITSGFSRDYIFRGADPMPDRLSARKTGRREVSDTAYRDADRRPCFSARGPPVAHQTTVVLDGIVRWRALGRDRRDRRLGGCLCCISIPFADLAANRPLRSERRG